MGGNCPEQQLDKEPELGISDSNNKEQWGEDNVINQYTIIVLISDLGL